MRRRRERRWRSSSSACVGLPLLSPQSSLRALGLALYTLVRNENSVLATPTVRAPTPTRRGRVSGSRAEFPPDLSLALCSCPLSPTDTPGVCASAQSCRPVFGGRTRSVLARYHRLTPSYPNTSRFDSAPPPQQDGNPSAQGDEPEHHRHWYAPFQLPNEVPHRAHHQCPPRRQPHGKDCRDPDHQQLDSCHGVQGTQHGHRCDGEGRG